MLQLPVRDLRGSSNIGRFRFGQAISGEANHRRSDKASVRLFLLSQSDANSHYNDPLLTEFQLIIITL